MPDESELEAAIERLLDAERMIDLLEVLDDQDDVDQVYANFDIPESVLEQLAA